MQKINNFIFGVSLALLTSCASPSFNLQSKTQNLSTKPTANPVPASRYSTPDNIKDSEIGSVSNKNIKHDLESVVLGGELLWIEKNYYPATNELSFAYTKDSDATMHINPGMKTITHRKDFVYIPTLVLNQVQEPAHTLELTASGPYGIRAKRTLPDIQGIERAISHSTEKDISFELYTIRISGEDFYTPRIENTNTNADVIKNYHIPVQGTSIEISPSGAVTLISKKGIYLPRKISIHDYYSRSTNMPSGKPTGQAESVK